MIIRNGTVITPFELLEETDIRMENGMITGIGKFPHSPEEEVDATGCYVSPGFIDIHTHGGYGGDFMDATEESFDKALEFHAEHGTTAVLPTSVTAPVEQIEEMLYMVRKYKENSHRGSRVLGAHLEGPYLSVRNKGAQKEEHLRIPDRDSYDFILKNKDICRRVTLSPELDGAAGMTETLVKNGIQVSGGHDDGRKALIMPAITAGMSSCTHWYCAMSFVAMRNLVRSVGLVEIGLLDDRLCLELLADNHHLPPELVRLAYRCKGADRLCLVSDSLRAAGMPADGALYPLGLASDETAQKFRVSDGVAVMEDGTHYAGSIQPVGQMVKNLVRDCQISIVDAVRMATLTPAKLIHMDDKLGSIAVNKKADICILDKDLCVVDTYINGEKMKRRTLS